MSTRPISSDKRLKILFLLTQDIESPSGVGRYFPLAKNLTALGNQVTLLALHPDYKHLRVKKYYNEGVLIWYISQMHVRKLDDRKYYFSSIELIFRMLFATIKMLYNALLIEFDIILIGKAHPMNGFVGLLLKFISRRPLYLDCDDYESESNVFANEFQKKIVKLSEKYIIKLATKITTNTYFMYNKICDWRSSNSNILYLPNGYDRARFPRPDPRGLEEIVNKLQISNKTIVGYIGSMSLKNHAVDFLIQAFSIVVSLSKQYVLILAGGGEDLDNLRALVKKLRLEEYVRFCGHVPSEDIVYYYHICHVTIDPVRDNDIFKGRFPLKVIESLACGTPVITSAVGDRQKLAELFPAIIITQAGNAASLAKEILNFDLNRKNTLIKSINSDLLAEFEWQTLSKKVYSFYK